MPQARMDKTLESTFHVLSLYMLQHESGRKHWKDDKEKERKTRKKRNR